MPSFCNQSCLSIDESEREHSHSYGSVSAYLNKCNQCGYRVFQPLPSLEMLNDFYAHEYWNQGDVEAESATAYAEFETGEGERADSYRRLNALLETNGINKNNLRIHDVGCGFGLAVHAFNKMGARATGTDLSERSIKAGNSLGNNAIVCAKAEDFLTQSGEKMDIIFMSHSLEHMLDPAQTLKDLMPFLADDGVFIILVPNGLYIRGVVDRFSKWQWCAFPNHLHYFTPKSLACLFQKVGLRLVDTVSGKYDYWPDDLAQKLFGRTKDQVTDWDSVLTMMANNVMGCEIQAVGAKSSSAHKPTERLRKTLAALGNEKNSLQEGKDIQRKDYAQLSEEVAHLQEELSRILSSLSWRVTAPLRFTKWAIGKMTCGLLRKN